MLIDGLLGFLGGGGCTSIISWDTFGIISQDSIVPISEGQPLSYGMSLRKFTEVHAIVFEDCTDSMNYNIQHSNPPPPPPPPVQHAVSAPDLQ